ncbi:hypothetical protein PG997_008693 [Apiospora hydei]|uniref:Uncharacterized protein n=1 Tax=Apiospora hydei TaxID=1337664 RepID=A0ABR1WBJ8_9PEZI
MALALGRTCQSAVALGVVKTRRGKTALRDCVAFLAPFQSCFGDSAWRMWSLRNPARRRIGILPTRRRCLELLGDQYALSGWMTCWACAATVAATSHSCLPPKKKPLLCFLVKTKVPSRFRDTIFSLVVSFVVGLVVPPISSPIFSLIIPPILYHIVHPSITPSLPDTAPDWWASPYSPELRYASLPP